LMPLELHKMSQLDYCSSIAKTSRAIVPIGSLEQHGPHLPVSTDSIIIEYIATESIKKIPSFILPVIPYGVSYEHGPLFNVSIQNCTLSDMLHDVCLSLIEMGVKNIILLNGHHGNVGVLQYVGQNLSGQIPQDATIYTINYWHLMKKEFDHAGEVETSIVLAIAPHLVRMDKAKANTKRLSKTKVVYSSVMNNPGSFIKITGNGVWGDPTMATAEKGRKLIDEILENLEQTVLDLTDAS
jgi:creatinine amidohydrolase